MTIQCFGEAGILLLSCVVGDWFQCWAGIRRVLCARGGVCSALLLYFHGCVELGNFRSIQIVLATQNLLDAVRHVLSSCSLPLNYIDAIAALQVSAAYSRLSQSTSVSPDDRFSRTVQSSILERFYGFSAHDQPHIRVRRVARDTLRLLAYSVQLCCYLLHIIPSLVGEWKIAMTVSISLSLCLSAHSYIVQTFARCSVQVTCGHDADLHGGFWIFFIHYVLPVWWMMSCLPIIVQASRVSGSSTGQEVLRPMGLKLMPTVALLLLVSSTSFGFCWLTFPLDCPWRHLKITSMSDSIKALRLFEKY